MLWPWSEIARLKRTIEWMEQRDTHRLFVSELRQNMALQAYRDLSAANKGIRRLVEKVTRLKEHP
jgi:hypothetical protein